MATRNERKKRAKLRAQEIERALREAERLAYVERFDPSPMKPCLPEPEYPCDMLTGAKATVAQKTVERHGVLQRAGRKGGKAFVRRDAPISEPLKHDGNASGYGQRKKRWI